MQTQPNQILQEVDINTQSFINKVSLAIQIAIFNPFSMHIFSFLRCIYRMNKQI